MDKTETLAAPAPAPAPAPAAAQPTLSLADLSQMLALIDVCSQRGCFQAADLSQVGALHDRISDFLAAHQPSSTEQQQTGVNND